MNTENLSNEAEKPELNKSAVSGRYFLIIRCNSFASGTSDIIGITDDEELAKSRESVFCRYEEVKFLKK